MFHAKRTSARSKSSRRISRRPVPAVEPLEGRLLLATYYVATNGSDSNNGTALTTPLANLLTAVNKTSPGDTIYVRGGTYRQGNSADEGIRINKGGNSSAYLTIAAYPGETPIFKGSQVVTGWQPITVASGVQAWYVPWTFNSQQVFVNGGTPLQQIGMPDQGDPNDKHWTTVWGEITNNIGYYPEPFLGATATQDNMTGTGQFYYNRTQHRLYISTNPTGATVEVSRKMRVFFSDASYIHLDGLTFMHNSGATFFPHHSLVYPGNNALVENSTFEYGDEYGLQVTDNSLSRNNRAINNGLTGLIGSGANNFVAQYNYIAKNNYRHFGTQWVGAGFKMFASDGIIENNEFDNNYGSGFWADTCQTGALITIRNNYIHDQAPDEAGIFFEASINGLIYNNVIANNHHRGIYVSGSTTVKIFNNTIVGQSGISAIDVYRRGSVYATNVTIRNNTISGGTSQRDLLIDLGTGNSSDYNNFQRSGTNPLILQYNGGVRYSLASWQSATGWDMHSLSVNPGFAAPSGANYQLASTSPLINKGTTLSEVPKDYAGTARPYGSAYDIGAYEYFPVDSIAPTVSSVQIGEGTVQRSIVQKATVVFSEKVNLNSGLNVRTGDGAVIANVTVAAANPSADMKTWVLTFSGAAVANGSLPDGVYQVLATTAVKDLAGNSLASNYTSAKFHRLYGDSDGNASVDALDLYRFRQCYLTSSGSSAFNALFDSDGNGSIDALDLFRFRNNYLKSYSY